MKILGFMVFGIVLLGLAALRLGSPLTIAMLQVDVPVVDYSLRNVEDLVSAIVNWTLYVGFGSNVLLAGFGLYFVTKGLSLCWANKMARDKNLTPREMA